MRNPIEARAFHVKALPDVAGPRSGTLRVSQVGVRFQPDDPGEPGIVIDVEQILAASLSTDPRADRAPDGRVAITIDTPGRRFRFTLADDPGGSAGEVVSAAREVVTERLGAAGEVTLGAPPARARRSRDRHVVLAVSDMSGGEEGAPQTLMVEVSTLGTPYSWKRRVPFPEDVHRHLVEGFDDLGRQAAGRAATRARELGALLLHNTLTARALDELRKLSPSTVTLRIDDLLAHLPWSVLHDGTCFPLLDIAASQQIATIDPPPPPPRRSAARRRALIVANPTGDLPAAEAEGHSVKEWFRRAARAWEVDLRTGSEASRTAVMSALSSGRYEIVHYAGHSTFDADDPGSSAWRLSDGKLTAPEIQQNVEGNPPGLVYASSCEGGRDGDRRSLSYHRRMFGLTSGLLMGGVRNHVGFFWPIPDRGAADLAAELYGALLVQGKTIAESLRLAKRKMWERNADPRLWGGAMLFGDPSSTWRAR
jgi:hypothetical protein